MPEKTTMAEEGKTLFAKQQRKGFVSEVEGNVQRIQPGSGIAPSGMKIFKGTTLVGNEKADKDFDPTASHSVSEVKGEDFRPQGKKIMKGTKLEGEEETKSY